MTSVKNKVSDRQIRTDLTATKIVGHVVIWLVLCLVTFGIGLLFWPYSFFRFVINETYLCDNSGDNVESLHCDIGISEQVGHILIWGILITISFGFLFPVYAYGVARTAINATQVVSSAAEGAL